MAISKEAVLEAEHRLIDGIKKSDIQYLTNVLHDELLFIAPDGRVITKQIDLDSHRRGDMVVESLIPAFEEIRILDNTATVIVVYETKGSMLGNSIHGKFRYIRIWKESAEGLKIIGGGCFILN